MEPTTLNSNIILGDAENCFVNNEERFWIPVIQGETKASQYLWVHDRPGFSKKVILNQTWHVGHPTGLLFQQCVSTSDEGEWYDVECETELKCSVCNVPVVQTYQLRGNTTFDMEYFLSFEMQQSTRVITFEGHESSRIFWYPLEAKTEIIDQKQNLSRTFNQNPFGLLGSKDAVIKFGYTDELTFTNVSSLFVAAQTSGKWQCLAKFLNFQINSTYVTV